MNKNESNSGTVEEFYYDSTEVSEGETVERHARVALPKRIYRVKKISGHLYASTVFSVTNILLPETIHNMLPGTLWQMMI